MSIVGFLAKQTTTFVKHSISSKTVLTMVCISLSIQDVGTPAADFEDTVSESEKTARFLELENVHRRCQEKVYSSYVGQTISVLSRAAEFAVGI